MPSSISLAGRAAALCALVWLAVPHPALAAGPSPVGVWRTFDDADGRESGAVTIFDKDGVLYGNVSGIADPARANATCTQCTDDRKDKPVMGLQILRGMTADGGDWDGGVILDPKTGKTYKCTMHLEDNGQKLLVRGYVGISLLGRTQTWTRR